MKKRIGQNLWIVLAVLLCLPAWADAAPAEDKPAGLFGIREISFTLLGGGNYTSGGEFNESLRSMNQWYYDLKMYPDINAGLHPVHLGFEIGGEVKVGFTPALGISLGFGCMRAGREDRFGANWVGDPSKIVYSPMITIWPVTLSGIWGLPMGERWVFSVRAGVGYYWGKIDSNWLRKSDLYVNAVERNIWDAKSQTFGFHGGVGLEFKIDRTFSVNIEGTGRYARLHELRGHRDSFSDFPGNRYSDLFEDDPLWSYVFTSKGKDLRRVLIFEEEPGYRDVRKAVVDLSGFSVRIGLKIRIR